MLAARFIVCEKTNRWAVALRWVLADAGVRVHETRSLADCWNELKSAPASLLGLELKEDNVEAIFGRLVELQQEFPEARAIVFGQRGMESCQWLLREAGALHVLFSTRNLSPAARLIRRHLARTPQRETGYRGSIWARMPWAE